MKPFTSLSTLLFTLAWSAAAQAHEGHGLTAASHWHATDTVGFALVAAVGAALWFTRGK